jgi:type VI secretion system protein VasJ
MADISFDTLGSSPVPGETPAGDNARYEEEYAAVLGEIDKLSFSGQREAVSWPAIEKNAVAILSEKSKDFQIAAYLGVALCRTRGFDGLLEGLKVLTGLFETFWETGWPALKRKRGRVTAIDWWHERAYGFLREVGEDTVSPELQKELLETLARLDDLVSALLPEASPLRDLTAAIQRLSLSASPADTPPDEPAAAPEASAAPVAEAPRAAEKAAPEPVPQPVQPAPPAETPALPATEDPAALRRQFVASGLTYLAAARRDEPDNPSHWQLSRLIIWGGIVSPPTSENGQTLLPGPDLNTLARARQKLEAGRALEAAREAEDFFATAPFALDAQETVHAALLALRFTEAAHRVMEETARFRARLPGVETLSFTDGTPFASPRTLAWLREAAARTREGGAEAGPPPGGGETPFDAARELMARNKLEEALAALDAAKTVSSAVNLRLRACQVGLLREGGRFEAAQALAEDVFRETTARGLDDWDPPLALEALSAVRGAFVRDEARYESELREVRRRIVRLRPAAALD